MKNVWSLLNPMLQRTASLLSLYYLLSVPADQKALKFISDWGKNLVFISLSAIRNIRCSVMHISPSTDTLKAWGQDSVGRGIPTWCSHVPDGHLGPPHGPGLDKQDFGEVLYLCCGRRNPVLQNMSYSLAISPTIVKGINFYIVRQIFQISLSFSHVLCTSTYL